MLRTVLIFGNLENVFKFINETSEYIYNYFTGFMLNQPYSQDIFIRLLFGSGSFYNITSFYVGVIIFIVVIFIIGFISGWKLRKK